MGTTHTRTDILSIVGGYKRGEKKGEHKKREKKNWAGRYFRTAAGLTTNPSTALIEMTIYTDDAIKYKERHSKKGEKIEIYGYQTKERKTCGAL
jgi:hypothetical protein